VSKPIDPQELVAAIEQLLDGKDPAERETALGDVFDRSALLGRVDGDEELMKLVVGTFLEDAPNQIRALNAACEGKDADGIRRQAHSLKSASGSAGAVRLQEVAHQIERAGENGDLDKAASLAMTVESEFEKMKGHIADLEKEQWR
jgi:two-component system sensor histidine kinase/response regulator